MKKSKLSNNREIYTKYRGVGFLLRERWLRFRKAEEWTIWHDVLLVVGCAMFGFGTLILILMP